MSENNIPLKTKIKNPDILIGNITIIIKKLKRLEELEKDIIERDKIIRSNNEFLEDLKFDFKQLIKRIKEYLGDD